ncbi:hypothetical protein CVT25_000510 [Psilocybe cyanescens]|uniref:Uncharacterized protein n=1 Tax=Psilocybe cyanescens TaxID=93625 RepID=A0A409XWA8_PSICY|nr:hypothetical protein CVT25_000510 [Psilocybe cyanescens]
MFNFFAYAATLLTIAIAALAAPQRFGESPGAIPVIVPAPVGFNITSLAVNGSGIHILPPHPFVQPHYRFFLFRCEQGMVNILTVSYQEIPEVSPPSPSRREMEGVTGLSTAASHSVHDYHQPKLKASASASASPTALILPNIHPPCATKVSGNCTTCSATIYNTLTSILYAWVSA